MTVTVESQTAAATGEAAAVDATPASTAAVDETPASTGSFDAEQKKREESLQVLHYDQDPEKMKDALMHHDGPDAAKTAAVAAPDGAGEAPPSPGRRVLNDLTRLSMRALNLGRDPENKDPQKPGDWGRPGELTEGEVKIFVSG
jgi:hypothetical protein